jgi:hypothetical protein
LSNRGIPGKMVAGMYTVGGGWRERYFWVVRWDGYGG